MQAQSRHPHRASHRAAAKQMLFVIYAAWFAALAIGTLTYAGEQAVKKHELPLRHVDAIFRRVGGLVIFGAWALRAALKRGLHLAGDGPPRPHAASDHLWIPAALYAAQAAVRAAIHQLHRIGAIFSPHRWAAAAEAAAAAAAAGLAHPPHVMSDHILLAAAAVGGLACEVVVLHVSAAGRRRRLSPALLRGLAAVVAALAVLLAAECFYTARYFHPPGEIVFGAVLGLVVFQAPLLLFSARLLRAHEAGDAAAAAAAAVEAKDG